MKHSKEQVGINYTAEKKLASKASSLTNSILEATDMLDDKLLEVKNCAEGEPTARYYRDVVFAAMQELRAVVDELETITPDKMWPFPTYADLLFKV